MLQQVLQLSRARALVLHACQSGLHDRQRRALRAQQLLACLGQALDCTRRQVVMRKTVQFGDARTHGMHGRGERERARGLGALGLHARHELQARAGFVLNGSGRHTARRHLRHQVRLVAQAQQRRSQGKRIRRRHQQGFATIDDQLGHSPYSARHDGAPRGARFEQHKGSDFGPARRHHQDCKATERLRDCRRLVSPDEFATHALDARAHLVQALRIIRRAKDAQCKAALSFQRG